MMSLICVRDFGYAYEKYDMKYVIGLDSAWNIQYEYCNLIESEKDDPDNYSFFENEEIIDYLKSFGVEYMGNYVLRSDDWGAMGSPHSEQFVTYLNYSLQLGCIALAQKNPIFINRGARIAVDINHIKPVLEKRDIYMEIDHYDWYMVLEYIREGCDVVVNGINVSERSIKDKDFNIIDFMEKEYPPYIRIDVDAEVFDESKVSKDIHIPRTITLKELARESTERDYELDTDIYPMAWE